MTRRPFFAGLVAVLTVVVVGIAIQAQFDAEKQSEPPHQARPVAAHTAPLPLAATGGEDISAALEHWIEGVERDRIAAEQVARLEAVGPGGGSGASSQGARAAGSSCGDDWDCFRECTIDHESRTSGVYGAVSPDGVYRGAFQFIGSTWRSVAVNAGYGEWADTPVDLVPAEVQDAVARFLWEHSGTQPWGGRC